MALTRLKGNQIFDDTITIADLAVTDGTSGQALLTDGSGALTFGDVDSLPTQSGSAGKFLKTDGTTATWEDASVGDGTLTIAKFAPSTFLVDSFVVTAPAGQQDFTLTRNPGSVYAMFVIVEGIIQKPITHYTVSGTTLSFTSVLPVDSEVEVHLNGFPSPLNAPADATVGRTTLLTTNSSASGLVLKVSSNNADLEWGTIDTLPAQSTHSGKFLTTDGSVASWSTITHPDEIPGQSGHNGKFLTTDGSVISWSTIVHPDELPSQTSNSGKFLTTDGSAASWADVPAVTVSDTPPGSPAHSDLWWDSALGKLKIYYNDGTSSQWVDAHQIGSIDPAMGGDLSGLASNAQLVANAVGATEIATNAVGITELNVADGTVGQALTTDGAGTLSFGDSGASVTISDTAPGSASAGDLWWKSDTGRLKVYYDDGSGAQWVDAFPVGSSDPAVGGDLTGTASNAQIAANAVGTAEIATDAVTSNEIVANAVSTSEIGTNAVTANELATTLDLSSKTVTLPAASVTAHVTQTDTSVLEYNIALLAFKLASANSLAQFQMVDQVVDEFVDATGIDASASTNEVLTSGYYGGGETATVTGGTITTHGSYTVHTFTASGTFEADVAGTADVLIVGGGGSSGGGHYNGGSGGGGGAGGVRVLSSQAVSATTHAVTVGDGATGSQYGNNGVDSSVVLGSTLTASGGGGGGFGTVDTSDSRDGLAGASGGGGGIGQTAKSGGAGNTPSTSPVQGYAGGNAATGGAGGGGGASEVGAIAPGAGSLGGVGGDGIQNDWRTGSNVYYGGGGGGSGLSTSSYIAGGEGGGGKSGRAGNNVGTAGTANTGGGGGGSHGANGSHWPGASGGSGIVVIRYDTTAGFTDPANMSLVSTTTTAEATPTTGDIVMLMEDAAGTATLNTDVLGYISKDAGTNWSSAVTFVDEGDWGTNKRILVARDVDISSLTGTTSMRYKIATANQSASKETRIHAVSLAWA